MKKTKTKPSELSRTPPDAAQNWKAYGATLPPSPRLPRQSKAERRELEKRWDKVSLTIDSSNLTDLTRIRADKDAASSYIFEATQQKYLGAHADYNRQRRRYKIGQVLLGIPELRGGDRASSKSEQTSKLASLLSGEREIYQAYSPTERSRLRNLARVPVALFEAAVEKSRVAERPMTDNQANKLANKFAGRRRKDAIRKAYEEADKELQASGGMKDLKARVNLQNCRFQDLHEKTTIPPLDAIVCDPPYNADAVNCNLFAELAEFADKHLKPGAPLVVMIGHCFINEIIKQVESKGFWLRWLLTVTYNAGEVHISDRQVNTKWKPVLLLQRQSERDAKREFRSLRNDWVPAGPQQDEDDMFHDWQQEVSTFEDLLNRFCEPKWLVCDPVSGWGTTAIACLRQRMKFIGCEMQEDRFKDAWGLVELEYRHIKSTGAKL